MNVTKEKNLQENLYDNLAQFWGVRRKTTGLFNNNKTYSYIHYIVLYRSISWFMKLYCIVGYLIL